MNDRDGTSSELGGRRKSVGDGTRRDATSHVVVKNDGLRLASEIHDELLATGLRVQQSLSLQLRATDIETWSPGYRRLDRAEELTRYLTLPMILIVVSGIDAVLAVQQVKARIRRRYTVVGMRNIIHAPNDTADAERELALFLSRATGPSTYSATTCADGGPASASH